MALSLQAYCRSDHPTPLMRPVRSGSNFQVFDMVLKTFLAESCLEIRRALVESMQQVAPIRFVGLANTEGGAHQWLDDRNHNWDLAIIDLQLNEGSGFGVLREHRDRTNLQKIVVLTGYVNTDIRQRCLQSGADGVFDKNRDIEKLVDFCKVHASYVDFMLNSGLVETGASDPVPLRRLEH